MKFIFLLSFVLIETTFAKKSSDPETKLSPEEEKKKLSKSLKRKQRALLDQPQVCIPELLISYGFSFRKEA